MGLRPTDAAAGERVRHVVAEAGGQTRRKVRTLTGYFGIDRLTQQGRERITQALRAAGVVAEPPLSTVGRDEFVRLILDGNGNGAARRPSRRATDPPVSSALPDLVEEIAPSVVYIETASGHGSGFALDRDRHVVTNSHVVDPDGEHSVKLSSGRTFSARLVGLDRSTDLAVLEVHCDELPTLPFRPLKTVRVGEPVVAVGSPLWLGWTVTYGIVSGLDLTLPAPDGGFIDYVIQSDAQINPGNSGGPLVALDGHVVGVNVAGIPGSGLGFAIPSDTADAVYNEIRQFGVVERGALGALVTIERFFGDDAEQLGQDGGARITQVRSGGPAADAGLETDDIIVSLDGELVDEPGDIFRLLNRERIGRQVEVKFFRDRTEHMTGVVPVPRQAR